MTIVMDTGARLFVGGQFRKAEQVETMIEAATGEPLGAGSAATESEIDGAVAAARAALPAYQSLKSIYRVGPA